jgi:large subunit ribosomal protein L1
MPTLSRRRKENAKIAPTAPMTAPEAVAALKKFKGPKFDQTVNVCMHLGVDPKQADQNLRGSIALPKGIGKTKRVVAFCQSDVAAKAPRPAPSRLAAKNSWPRSRRAGWTSMSPIAVPDMMRMCQQAR